MHCRDGICLREFTAEFRMLVPVGDSGALETLLRDRRMAESMGAGGRRAGAAGEREEEKG